MGNHFFYGRGPLKGQGGGEGRNMSLFWTWSSFPLQPHPSKKIKKISCRSFARFITWVMRSFWYVKYEVSVLSVRGRKQHTEISKCRKSFFFLFFFWGRETKKNPKKLKRRDLKNNTWAWLIVFTYFSWPRLRDRHIFIRKLRRIPILRNNNGLHRHISKQGQTNPCKMFSKEWKPLCTNPHLMLESKWLRCW